jgi:hypothetical protein
MSLDATILAVEREGADLVLHLGPRIQDDDRLAIAGQSTLRIIGATWEPPVGADLWGSSLIEIIPGHWYRREGYTRLYEREPIDV